MADLQTFLAGASLGHYYDALVQLGVSCPADLEDAEDEDLLGIGIKQVEIQRMRRAMAPGAEMPKEGKQVQGELEGIAPVMVVPDWQPGQGANTAPIRSLSTRTIIGSWTRGGRLCTAVPRP